MASLGPLARIVLVSLRGHGVIAITFGATRQTRQPRVSVAFRAADFYGSPGPSSPLTLFTRLHSRRLLSSSPARSLSLFSTRPTPGLLPPDARIAALYMHRPTEGTSPYNPDQCDGNQDRALAPVRHPSVDFSFRLLYAWAAVDPVAHRPPKSVRGGSQRERRASEHRAFRVVRSGPCEFGSRDTTRLSLPLSHTNSPAYPPPPPERPGPPTRTPQTFKHHTLSRRPPPRRGNHPLRQHDDSRCPARRSPREGTPPQRPTQQSPNQPRDVCLRVRVHACARRLSRVPLVSVVLPKQTRARRKDRYGRNHSSVGFEIPRTDSYPATRTGSGLAKRPGPPPRSRAYTMSSQRTV